MRRALVLALVGCSAPSGAPDAAPPDAPADASKADSYDRTVNRVLVAGEEFVYWSHGRFACPLEDPCRLEGPAVTAWWRGSDHVSPRYQGGVGARSIVGTADERFFVTGLDFDSMYLVRDRGVPTAFSVPRPYTIGPAIDATHVYWAETPSLGAGYTLRRASRDGDGGDMTVVATELPLYGDGTADLIHAAGYIWWIAGITVQRVPVTGGTPEVVAAGIPKYPQTIVAHGDVVYTVAVPESSNGSPPAELGRIDADGTYTRLLEHQADHRSVRFLVVTDDALYWSRRDGNIYRAPIAGGAIETIAADDQVGYAFAVLPDRLLVELTGDSFRAIPR